MQESQDRELLRQYARENSDEAFAALVSRHVDMVYSAALRKTGNPAAAEEITQAVFVILAKKAKGLIRHAALSGWLYQAARLTAANFLRTEIRRARREQEAYMQSLSNQTESEIWPQIMPLLEDAMGRLGEKDRNALSLRFFEGKSFQEIGAAFGVSENAARKRTNHALEKLRTYFSQCGVTSTAETFASAISTNSIQAAPALLAKSATAVALAKGAAASTSTLTLVKGALKIMAWTKAKTAIVAGVGLLLAVGTATVTVKEVKSSRDNAIFERIWAQPDSRSMDALIHAPPALIVRPAHYPQRGGRGFWTDARIGHGVWLNASVSELVGMAYHFPPERTVFPPGMPGGKFDLMETLPAGQNEDALKKEIQRRFGLLGHTETRETEALRLVVSNPERLSSHVSAGGPPGAYGTGAANNTMSYVFKNQTLKEVASGLESYFDQPMVEPDSLTGHYDFTFQVGIMLQGDALQNSLRDQLTQFGLELVPSRAPVETLVIEKAK